MAAQQDTSMAWWSGRVLPSPLMAFERIGPGHTGSKKRRFRRGNDIKERKHRMDYNRRIGNRMKEEGRSTPRASTEQAIITALSPTGMNGGFAGAEYRTSGDLETFQNKTVKRSFPKQRTVATDILHENKKDTHDANTHDALQCFHMKQHLCLLT